MSIILIRHGETLLNVARTLQPADTPLSPAGQAQAAAVAERLAAQGARGLVSSDLPRALATAEAISGATGLPVMETPLLQERNFGALRGQAYDALGFDPLTMIEAPAEGESAADFAARVARAWDHVVARRRELDGPLLVVTHGLVIHAMLQAHVSRPAAHPVPGRLGNTSVTVIDAVAPHSVSLMDCTAHLAASPADDDPRSLSGG